MNKLKKAMKVILPIGLGVIAAALLASQIYTMSMLSDLQRSVRNISRELEETRRPRTTTEANHDNSDNSDGEQQQEQQPPQEQQPTQPPQEQQHTQPTQEQQQTQEGEGSPATVQNGDISATLTSDESWGEGGKTATKISMVVKNNGEQPVSKWSVTIDVPQGSEVKGDWNCDTKIEGTKLTITSTTDKTLNKDEVYDDAGFIILSEKAFTP